MESTANTKGLHKYLMTDEESIPVKPIDIESGVFLLDDKYRIEIVLFSEKAKGNYQSALKSYPDRENVIYYVRLIGYNQDCVGTAVLQDYTKYQVAQQFIEKDRREREFWEAKKNELKIEDMKHTIKKAEKRVMEAEKKLKYAKSELSAAKNELDYLQKKLSYTEGKSGV